MRLFYKCLISLLVFSGCNSLGKITSPSSKYIVSQSISEGDDLFWYQKDYLNDNICGISIEKWYDINKKKQKKSIIVAVIDSQIDFEHADIKNQIWFNKKEIPNNKIDDDKNGYIDDLNGWSFLGTKTGGFVIWANFEYVRIIRKWDAVFKDKLEINIPMNELNNYRYILILTAFC